MATTVVPKVNRPVPYVMQHGSHLYRSSANSENDRERVATGRRPRIGLSILSGAHNAIVPRVMDLLKQNKMDDILVVVGASSPIRISRPKKAGVAQFSNPVRPWMKSSPSSAPM